MSVSALLVAGARTGAAQRGARWTLGASTGASFYYLAGTGTAWFNGLSVALQAHRLVILEGSLGLLRHGFDAPFSGVPVSETILLPELGVQFQVPIGALRPYVGGGAGLADGYSTTRGIDATLHAATGLRLDLTDRLGLRTDLRVRTIRPFSDFTLDWAAGLSIRL